MKHSERIEEAKYSLTKPYLTTAEIAKSKYRANELSVKLREVFGDKRKFRFSENQKGIITGVGLISLGLLPLVGGEDKHSHLKKIEDQMELQWLMKELVQRRKISFEELAKEQENE